MCEYGDTNESRSGIPLWCPQGQESCAKSQKKAADRVRSQSAEGECWEYD